MKLIRAILLVFIICPAYGFDLLIPKRLTSYKISDYVKLVTIPAFEEAGIKVNPVYLSEAEINGRIKQGNYDGLFGKIDDGGGISYSVQIPYPIVKKLETSSYSLKSAPKNKKIIKVGVIKGVLAHSKAVIMNRSLFSRIKYYKTYSEVIEALLKGEIDQFLMSQLEYIHEVAPKNKKLIKKSSKSLYSTAIFSYIHERHKEKLESINMAFKTKDEEGILNYPDFIKKYYQK